MSTNDHAPTIAHSTEFETKYRVDPSSLIEFKRIMDTLPNLNKFIYIEGADDYYTNEHITNDLYAFADSLNPKDKARLEIILATTIANFPPFMRYRKPSHGLDNNRKELTTKYKRDGVKNNIQREEKNIRVDITDEWTIKTFIEDIGYERNFSIWKTAHIYNFEDATVVFYSVYDTTDGKVAKVDNFVEIEISEEKVSKMTESQAWQIICEYERHLETIGITSRNRLKKSLFEMYKRDVK